MRESEVGSSADKGRTNGDHPKSFRVQTFISKPHSHAVNAPFAFENSFLSAGETTARESAGGELLL